MQRSVVPTTAISMGENADQIPYYLSMVNVANFVSTRLTDHSSYIIWKAQMLCLLQSQDLLGFIDGTSIPSPPETTVTDDAVAAATDDDDDDDDDKESSSGRSEIEINKDYLKWKRIDCFVKGWMLGSLSEQVVGNVVHEATSRDVWLVLEQLYSPKSQDGICLSDCVAILQRAVSSVLKALKQPKIVAATYPYTELHCGDWVKAQTFFKREKEASRAQINSLLQTALHVAVGVQNEKGNHFVKQLVATMENEDLAIRDCLGDTALHYAARFGNLDAAEVLVSRNPSLPHISCFDDLYPIHHAAEYGCISVDVFAYFLRVTTDPAPYTGLSGVRLLYRLIHSDLYNFAKELVEENPDLARYGSNERSALKELAMKEFSFLSGSRLNFWQQLIYRCVPVRSTSRCYHARSYDANDLENVVKDSQMLTTKDERIYFTTVVKRLIALLFDVLERIVPLLKHVRDKKSIHHNAVKFAECLCDKIESLSDREVDSIVSHPLLEAARYGTYELVEIIVRRFPSLAYYYDRDQKNIFHIAIENRCENVFNLVYQMSQHRHQLMTSVDSSSNTMLHLAGKLAPQNKLNLVSGPALQMQRELQWFKEVKKFVPPSYWELLNHAGKPPHVVFSEEHEKLKAEGEKWMKDTSNSCTITAALIATIAFAAAITVPGGNAEQSGLPIFSGNIAFVIFAISNSASLFTSSTSLLVFLSVLTSRYAEEDFLLALPRSLILGLLTLFLSITFMMVSFSATVYLVFGQKKAWVLVPVATMACLPITSFVLLQFPLLVAVISSTYGRGIFGKRSHRLLYS